MEKPEIKPVEIENIPQALRDINRWFLWEYVAKREGDWSKIPKHCNDALSWGSGTNSDGLTFKSFEEATAWMDSHRSRGSNVGLAFAMAPKGQTHELTTGIDLDLALTSDGMLKEWADKILREVEDVAYAEISPSGKGLKVIVSGSAPTKVINKKSFGPSDDKEGVEVYDYGRFWTMTGDIWGDDNYGEHDPERIARAMSQAGVDVKTEQKRPAQRIQRVKITSDSDDRVQKYLARIAPPGNGNRNTTLFGVAGRLKVNFEISDERVFQEVLAYNMTLPEPHEESGLRNSIQSSLNSCHERLESTSENREPVPVVVESSDEPRVDFDALLKNQKKRDKQTLREDDLFVGGLISEVMQNNKDVAKSWLPELAFASALNVVAVAMAGRVEIKGNGAVPCIFSVGLAKSGAGKDFGRKQTDAILFEAGMVDRIGPEGLSSAEGFVKIMEKQNVALFQLDEAGEMFGDMADSKSHMKRLGTAMKNAYSKAGSKFWKPNARADAANNIVIEDPHPVIYCTTTPDRFWSSFSESSVEDGLLGRLLIFENAKYDKRLSRKFSRPEITDSIVRQVKAWKGEGNLPDGVAVRKKFSWELTDEAQSLFVDFDNEVILKSQKGGTADALFARAADKIHILALLIAGSRLGPVENGEINADDMAKAIHIVKRLTYRVIERCTTTLVVNETDSNRKYVLRRVSEAGRLEKGKISRVTQKLKRTERKQIIDDLLESGDIVLEEDQDTGEQWYRAL